MGVPGSPGQPHPEPAPVPEPLSPPASQAADSGDDEVAREVADAMAEMPAEDLAELSGGFPTMPPIETLTSDSLEPGTELTGAVAMVTDDEIFLEFGPKTQGVLPRNQFGKKEPLEKGRRVDVVVEKYDAEQGLLIVNRKGAMQRATWQNLVSGMIVQGRVTGLNKGGLEVDVNGLRAFMPASQVDIAMIKDISVLLNEVVRAEVIEVDRREKNILISRKKLMQKELREQKQAVLGELEVGQVRSGIVGNITEFGAFVDLGGVDGLVHISDIRWGPVDKVSDYLKPGDEVQVQVLKIDKKRDRISLGIKQTMPDPWDAVADKYPVGTETQVTVMRLADFGAFAELESGIEGLIPISEMSWGRVNRAEEAVKVGESINCVVIRCEPKKRRLALSIKQATPDPWAGVLESFAPQSLVTGKVTRLTNFGAFVEVAPGVEGLIHISELSDKHVKSCGEVVQVGQEVETRVLGVDAENRRISLSIKAVTGPVTDMADTGAPAPSKPKKRKKPLRGGLSSHWDWEGQFKLDSDG